MALTEPNPPAPQADVEMKDTCAEVVVQKPPVVAPSAITIKLNAASANQTQQSVLSQSQTVSEQLPVVDLDHLANYHHSV